MAEEKIKKPIWNYHPQLPLEMVPYWHWPLRPLAIVKWLWENFLQVSDRALYIAYAIVIALWLMPFGAHESDIAWQWARWGYANGLVDTISETSNPIWFLLLFPVLTLFQVVHFYFIHRLIHWPPAYKWIHFVHHRNINVGPWLSGWVPFMMAPTRS